jgi:surface polysaccharide O-acyltransferase-like enzyme
VAAVWALPQRTSRRLQAPTSTSVGSYVLHMGMFLLLTVLARGTGLAPSPLQLLAATFVLSMALTLLLQRSPLRPMV